MHELLCEWEATAFSPDQGKVELRLGKEVLHFPLILKERTKGTTVFLKYIPSERNKPWSLLDRLFTLLLSGHKPQAHFAEFIFCYYLQQVSLEVNSAHRAITSR